MKASTIGGRKPLPAFAWCVFLVASLLVACSPPEEEELPVVLAADPPSLLLGESVVVTLTALEPFFIKDLEGPFVGEGGLVIESITRESKTRAYASVISTAETLVGAHLFAFELGGQTADLTLSVFAEQPGPGTISIDGDTASAGASNATLEIMGNGTHFDSQCTVHVEGADGITVETATVTAANRIVVRYSIEWDQDPTVATLVVLDGLVRYEAPFSIVSPASFETVVGGQALTKGRAGWVVFAHPGAALHQGTRIDPGDGPVEAGAPDVIDSTEVRIPVRVPFDHPGDTLKLTAISYGGGGAFVETITADVDLFEPAFVAVVPSRIPQVAGQQVVELVAEGVDLSSAVLFEADGPAGVALAAWSAGGPGSGTATFELEPWPSSGAIALTVDDGRRLVHGVAGVVPFGKGTWKAEAEIARGDRLLLPVVVYGGSLVADDIWFDEAPGFQIAVSSAVDSGCVVVDLAVTASASVGFHTLSLGSGGEQFGLTLAVVDSGI
jgi:hypothetical protein